jgi:heat-inducible transcriptional repressor
MADEIGDRAKDVLKVVVEEFISKGEPVGSSQLTRRGEFEVSPATMRNVLAELEELGYLEKPHTSAGRVPTDMGYRFFVDTLLQLKEPAPNDRKLIQQGLAGTNVEERLGEASKVLYQLSHHAAVVLTPRPSALVVTKIEFVRLRDDRVLAILIGQGGQVQNKLVAVDFAVSSEELVQAANYLNDLLRQGVNIEDVRGRILNELDAERAQYESLASKALRLGAAATDLSTPERVLIEGTGTFLEAPEFAEDVKRMRTLFKALDEKHKLLNLLDRVQRGREMQIFIGAESEFSSQGDVSVIATPYASGDTVLGTVGVIGPTRMDYQRIIPLVNFTAQVLSKALGEE